MEGGWDVHGILPRAGRCKLWSYIGRSKEEFERDAKRAVVIPKYDEIPVTVIRNNMKTVGMTREDYFSILRSI